MSLYDIIINRTEQAKVRPAYKLKNCRERLARYSDHLMFLTKCRTHGIIPQGLRVILPVHSTKVDTITITKRPSHALVRERIGEVHRHKEMLARRIMRLETDLSQTLDADAWPRITYARVLQMASTMIDRSGSSAPVRPKEPHLNPC